MCSLCGKWVTFYFFLQICCLNVHKVKCLELEIGLEFKYNGFIECNNFSDGSSKCERDPK